MKHPNNPYPHEFLERKMNLSASIWSFADKHECVEATELVLNHLLEILRFDVHDHLHVKDWIVWMFLHLGKYLLEYIHSCTYFISMMYYFVIQNIMQYF